MDKKGRNCNIKVTSFYYAISQHIQNVLGVFFLVFNKTCVFTGESEKAVLHLC